MLLSIRGRGGNGPLIPPPQFHRWSTGGTVFHRRTMWWKYRSDKSRLRAIKERRLPSIKNNPSPFRALGLGQSTVPLLDYTLARIRVRDCTSKFLGLGLGTVPLYDYTIVRDSGFAFMVRDPTYASMVLGLGQGTSMVLGSGQGTVALFNYTLVSDSYFGVRDPTSKFLGLVQGTLQYRCSIICYTQKLHKDVHKYVRKRLTSSRITFSL